MEQQVESEVVDNNTLAVLTKVEIDQQIATAKAYPRSVKNFVNEATSLATLNEEIAADCFYVLPDREGKSIEGPNARLGEIIMSCWGNCRGGARIVAEENGFIVAQGIFHDLERNTQITYEVKRRITYKNGNRYSGDMIGVTGNAACSIAFRNAVFKSVPKAFWDPIYKSARKTALGNIQTITSRRASMIEYWAKFGITPEKICATLGVESLEDVGQKELLKLRGYANAVKEGDITPDELFNKGDSSETQTKPTQTKENSELNDKLKKKVKQKKADDPGVAGNPKDGKDDGYGADDMAVEHITKIALLKDESEKKNITNKRKGEIVQECDDLEALASDVLKEGELKNNLNIINEIREAVAL